MATNSGSKGDSGMKDLPAELQNILADEDGNGSPDIADNPLKALGKLGDLMSLSNKMNPMVQRYIQSRLAKMNVSADVISQIAGGSLQGGENSANAANLINKANMENASAGSSVENFSGAGGAMNLGGSTPPQARTPRSAANIDAYLSAHGVKTVQSSAGRNFLFVLGVLAIIGWLAWSSSGPQFQASVTSAVIKFFEE